MRFLKTLTLNRRAIYDSRVALDMNENFTVADSNAMILPKSNGTVNGTTTGHIRYNTTTNQVEVYQGSSGQWRSLRFKESTEVTYEPYVGNGSDTVFGPLNPQPPTIVETSALGATKTWSGKNLVVIVGGVYQIHGTNYEIELGSTIGAPYDTSPNDNLYFIRFTSAVPGLTTPITIIRGFDR